MTDALSITLSSALSKHIKVLKKAGLISRSTLAQLRPCQLEPVPLKRSYHLNKHISPTIRRSL